MTEYSGQTFKQFDVQQFSPGTVSIALSYLNKVGYTDTKSCTDLLSKLDFFTSLVVVESFPKNLDHTHKTNEYMVNWLCQAFSNYWFLYYSTIGNG